RERSSGRPGGQTTERASVSMCSVAICRAAAAASGAESPKRANVLSKRTAVGISIPACRFSSATAWLTERSSRRNVSIGTPGKSSARICRSPRIVIGTRRPAISSIGTRVSSKNTRVPNRSKMRTSGFVTTYREEIAAGGKQQDAADEHDGVQLHRELMEMLETRNFGIDAANARHLREHEQRGPSLCERHH